jgi:ATP-dependent helicase HrpA
VAAAGLPRTRAAYLALRDSLRDALEDQVHGVLKSASGLIAHGRRVEAAASRVAELSVLNSVADIKEHAAALLGAGFLTRASLNRLRDLGRYLAGDEYRLERLGSTKDREAQALHLLEELRRAYDAALAAAEPGTAAEPTGAPPPATLAEVPWMLEELRISLLAQPLGTAYPISEKRIRRALSP